MGDWTQELFRLSLGDLRMPIWISAAQPSVLEKSIYFDNGEIGFHSIPRLDTLACLVNRNDQA